MLQAGHQPIPCGVAVPGAGAGGGARRRLGEGVPSESVADLIAAGGGGFAGVKSSGVMS